MLQTTNPFIHPSIYICICSHMWNSLMHQLKTPKSLPMKRTHKSPHRWTGEVKTLKKQKGVQTLVQVLFNFNRVPFYRFLDIVSSLNKNFYYEPGIRYTLCIHEKFTIFILCILCKERRRFCRCQVYQGIFLCLSNIKDSFGRRGSHDVGGKQHFIVRVIFCVRRNVMMLFFDLSWLNIISSLRRVIRYSESQAC